MSVDLRDEVMTLEDVSVFLKVGDQTIYNLTRDGSLPARKVGREWRYLKSEVLTFMTSLQGSQDGVVQLDGFDGEYKVEDGETVVALWLPMTLEQKEAQVRKALAEGTTVSRLVTEFLDRWMKQ